MIVQAIFGHSLSDSLLWLAAGLLLPLTGNTMPPDFILLNYSLRLISCKFMDDKLGYTVAWALLSSWHRTRCSFHYSGGLSSYCSEYFR